MGKSTGRIRSRATPDRTPRARLNSSDAGRLRALNRGGLAGAGTLLMRESEGARLVQRGYATQSGTALNGSARFRITSRGQRVSSRLR